MRPRRRPRTASSPRRSAPCRNTRTPRRFAFAPPLSATRSNSSSPAVTGRGPRPPSRNRRLGPGSEHLGPVVADAYDRPALAVGSFERLLGAGGVVELALGVVVEEEQAQEWPVAVLREVEHRDVAVRVAGCE